MRRKKPRPDVPKWLQRPKGWPQPEEKVLPKKFGYRPRDDISTLQIRDVARWLTKEQLNDPALEAVWWADKTQSHDPKKIIDLLKSDVRLSAWGRQVIADWLWRFTTDQRGPKTPKYALTYVEVTMKDAVASVLRRQGMSQAQAIEKVAIDNFIPLSTLQSAVRRERQRKQFQSI